MEFDKARNLAGEAMDVVLRLGVDYGDIRLLRKRGQVIVTEDRRVMFLSDNETYGFGVRIVAGGSWGFAGSNVVTPEEIERVTRLAVEVANASATTRIGTGVELLPQHPIKDTWISRVKIDPFTIPMEEKSGLMLEVSEKMLGVKGVAKTMGFMLFEKVDKLFASTAGAEIETTVFTTSASITATATGGGDAKKRTYSLPSRTTGYELVHESDFPAHAERIGEEAVQHLKAQEGPSGKRDLILLPSHLCLTIHESVGHATELDRAEGAEESLAGRSFATPDKLGKLQYASPIVNFKADNTLPNGLATLGYDDDGVPGKAWHIVRDGVFTGYSTNRETGAVIGSAESLGCCRADSWKSIPIVRMPNLGLEPGKERLDLDGLIADTKDGILIDGSGSFSIDQMRVNFQFGGDAFWEIKNGKITRMLKNVNYQAITTEFWNSCDAICDERSWEPHGVTNCGKGDPVQISRITHGSSPARFRNINVGGIRP